MQYRILSPGLKAITFVSWYVRTYYVLYDQDAIRVIKSRTPVIFLISSLTGATMAI